MELLPLTNQMNRTRQPESRDSILESHGNISLGAIAGVTLDVRAFNRQTLSHLSRGERCDQRMHWLIAVHLEKMKCHELAPYVL